MTKQITDNMNLFLISILVAAPLYVGLRAISRWHLFRDRKIQSLEDLYRSSHFRHPVEFQTFAKLLSLVAECYHVVPGRLRTEDTFDGRLGKFDTWDLGGGAEDLTRRLEKEFSIVLPPDTQIGTIQELIEYCVTFLPTLRNTNGSIEIVRH